MKHLAPVLLAAVISAAAVAVRAQAPADRRLAAVDACVLSDAGARYFDSLEEVPEPIRTDLLSRTGPMAARQAPFNATDFTTSADADLPHHRFLRAAHSGLRWMIWYEHGGYGDHVHLAVYVLAVRGADPTPIASPSGNLVGPPCAVAEAVLKGVAAASPKDW